MIREAVAISPLSIGDKVEIVNSALTWSTAYWVEMVSVFSSR